MYSALYSIFVLRKLCAYIHDVHIYSVTCTANNHYENQLINRLPITSITSPYKHRRLYAWDQLQFPSSSFDHLHRISSREHSRRVTFSHAIKSWTIETQINCRFYAMEILSVRERLQRIWQARQLWICVKWTMKLCESRFMDGTGRARSARNCMRKARIA